MSSSLSASCGFSLKLPGAKDHGDERVLLLLHAGVDEGHFRAIAFAELSGSSIADRHELGLHTSQGWIGLNEEQGWQFVIFDGHSEDWTFGLSDSEYSVRIPTDKSNPRWDMCFNKTLTSGTVDETKYYIAQSH